MLVLINNVCVLFSDSLCLFSLQNIPTLGTVAITMALHNCDEVAVAGFGYDMNTPHAPLHYYETVKMSAIKEVSFYLFRLRYSVK